MKKNIILSIAKVFSYFWLFIPSKIRRFIFTSFLILESRDNNQSKSIKNLFLIKDKLDWIINERAIKYGNGIHPKHLLTNYHQFFIDRIKDGERVLDVGCGNGAVAISIAKKYSKSLITGIDLNKNNIKLAKEKQKKYSLKNLNFINCDINACTEIRSDIVILSNVLEHIENRSLFLENIHKLSGANLFLIRVPYFKRDWQIAFRKKLGIYYFSDPDHKIEHTLEELKQELKISNFTVNETIVVWGEIWTKCEYEV
jgi:SAM-dependent methyltransferase